jgi:hypothetical protein
MEKLPPHLWGMDPLYWVRQIQQPLVIGSPCFPQAFVKIFVCQIRELGSLDGAQDRSAIHGPRSAELSIADWRIAVTFCTTVQSPGWKS